MSGLAEGDSVTVKWRGKPVFIRHRCDIDMLVAALTMMTMVAGRGRAASTDAQMHHAATLLTRCCSLAWLFPFPLSACALPCSPTRRLC